ncbi:MAG: response regulator [Anaerolineae bacterium]
MAARDDGEPGGEFIGPVADALGRLYEPSGLLRGPLADWLIPADASPERRSRALRALLLESIESLRPGGEAPFRSPAARSYHALRLYYVEGRTAQDVGHRLAVSTRQAYRDIRKGEADLALLLWQRRPRTDAETPRSAGRALRQEVERLQLSATSVSLQQSLCQAAAALGQLAQGMGRPLPTDLDQDLLVSADPVGLRQCLTAMLSCALQASSGDLSIEARLERDATVLCVLAEGGQPLALSHLNNLVALARTLAQASGGHLESGLEAGRLCLELRLPLKPSATIVVIDDNEGLPLLFQRYLAGSECTIVGVSDPDEGLRLARQHTPSAIVLDILLPGADGWSLLAQLKADPVTASVPVIVCSVFSDTQLAHSLGAAACIPKPVSAVDLQRVLSALGIAT